MMELGGAFIILNNMGINLTQPLNEKVTARH